MRYSSFSNGLLLQMAINELDVHIFSRPCIKSHDALSSGPQERKNDSSLPNARPKRYWMAPQSHRFVTQAPQPQPHRLLLQIISQLLHPREDGRERVKLHPEL